MNEIYITIKLHYGMTKLSGHVRSPIIHEMKPIARERLYWARFNGFSIINVKL